MRISQIGRAAVVLAICLAVSPPTLTAEAQVCAALSALGWPKTKGLSNYALRRSLDYGQKEDASEHYFNVDIDGDDIEDELTKSCSPSLMPGDPCLLEVDSSLGGKYEFKAWRMFLIRLGGKIYAVTSEIPPSDVPKPNKIFRIDSRKATLVCEK